MKIRNVLLVTLLLSLNGCKGKGPDVTICLLDPVNNTLECGRADKTTFTLLLKEIPEGQSYACLELSDMQKVITYAKQKCDVPKGRD